MKAASKLTSSLTDLECENIIDSRIYKNLQTHLNKPKEKMEDSLVRVKHLNKLIFLEHLDLSASSDYGPLQ